jgi:hypothetical protein
VLCEAPCPGDASACGFVFYQREDVLENAKVLVRAGEFFGMGGSHEHKEMLF